MDETPDLGVESSEFLKIRSRDTRQIDTTGNIDTSRHAMCRARRLSQRLNARDQTKTILGRT
jgi:hypothetical protein